LDIVQKRHSNNEKVGTFCMAYRMASIPMTLSDPENHFSYLKPFKLLHVGKYSTHYL